MKAPIAYVLTDGPGTLIESGETVHYGTLRKKQQKALRGGYTMTFGPVRDEALAH